jgi:hypothetical protein
MSIVLLVLLVMLAGMVGVNLWLTWRMYGKPALPPVAAPQGAPAPPIVDTPLIGFATAHRVDIDALRAEVEQDPSGQDYAALGQNYAGLVSRINSSGRAAELGFVGLKTSDVQQVR